MKPKEKAERLSAAIAELELTADGSNDLVIAAAKRIAQLEHFDAAAVLITVFHNGTRKLPWMFEIRRHGMLRGAFEGFENGWETREEAETKAFEVAESMLDGTFEIRFTS